MIKKEYDMSATTPVPLVGKYGVENTMPINGIGLSLWDATATPPSQAVFLDTYHAAFSAVHSPAVKINFAAKASLLEIYIDTQIYTTLFGCYSE